MRRRRSVVARVRRPLGFAALWLLRIGAFALLFSPILLVIVVIAVLLGAFIAIQAKRRSGGVIISDRKRGRK